MGNLGRRGVAVDRHVFVPRNWVWIVVSSLLVIGDVGVHRVECKAKLVGVR